MKKSNKKILIGVVVVVLVVCLIIGLVVYFVKKNKKYNQLKEKNIQEIKDNLNYLLQQQKNEFNQVLNSFQESIKQFEGGMIIPQQLQPLSLKDSAINVKKKQEAVKSIILKHQTELMNANNQFPTKMQQNMIDLINKQHKKIDNSIQELQFESSVEQLQSINNKDLSPSNIGLYHMLTANIYSDANNFVTLYKNTEADLHVAGQNLLNS